MKKYHKEYTRENSFYAIQVWEDTQCRRLKDILGENIDLSLFDARGGVVSVWYGPNLETWLALVERNGKRNQTMIIKLMDLYAERITKVETLWKKGAFSSREELIDFYPFMIETWIGLSISYCLPYLTNLPQELQELGMKLRERSQDFLDATDKVIISSLKKFYPELGDLVKYLSIEEIKTSKFDVEELKKREQHYIYYNFQIITGINDLRDFATSHNIELDQEIITTDLKEIKG